ncbi:BrnA antitoxin family protein [Sneathiella marina]|uniref:BrnA antitoxin family protein n=1 Tax=Sneathiella marina TaxID=2950108 RepID=A0ABY4W5F5_9PROT|nr:BrnA antitoxin family protein [Sneathiella marina]USG61112.1 BrnA antitoxin family protein [Sneathiella marina]
MTDKKKVDPFMVDDDNPEWTEQDIKNARPGREIFKELGMTAPKPKIGRPKLTHPKKQVTVRLDADVIARLKEDGGKWQTKLNDTLRLALKL